MNYYKPYLTPAETPQSSINPTSEIKDLLLGVSLYGIYTDAPISENFLTDHFNTPDNAFTLTNGVRAEVVDYKDPAFTHFTGGTGRYIVYRLNNLSAVNAFSVTFLRQKEVGIRLPYRFDVYLSQNGTEWQRVYKKRRFEMKGETELVTVKQDFDKTYKAAWVRFEFDIPAHIWVENASLYGSTEIGTEAADIVPDIGGSEREALVVDRYPDYSELCDTHNIFLAYNCMPPEYDTNGIGGFTEADLIPYLGYIDAEGKMSDTFFDSALFLPFSRFTYSKLYKCAEGWRYYVDNTFAEGKNVDALNSASKTVSETLGVDFKAKVFLSILHTKPGYGDFPEKFGDLDGDGIDEDMTSFEDRKKAVKWVIDTQLARYNEKQRDYLNLVGFYWFEEEINYNDPFELDLLSFASDYVHSLGYKLIWIPYYQAWGYDEWQKNGFDIACIQPNYSFRNGGTSQRLYDNAALAKRFGLCYELELNDLNNPADVEKYKEYLQAGIDTGFMKTIKMYYQGGRCFLSASRSNDKFIRSVYDDTYLFAKEKLIKPLRLSDL